MPRVGKPAPGALRGARLRYHAASSTRRPAYEEPRMPRPVQTLANHARIVPLYHLVLGPILLVNLAASGRALFREPGAERGMAFAVAFGLLILFWYARVFALKAQDRVIRLEMRLRLERLLPAPQLARFDEIGVPQLVALRFAGDAELPGLVEEVLAGRLIKGDDIKRRIKDWQADWLRA
jgi:hypothetical protein